MSAFWRAQDARQARRRALGDALRALAAKYRVEAGVPLEWHSDRGGALVGGEPLDRIIAGENVWLMAANDGPAFCVTPNMVRHEVLA